MSVQKIPKLSAPPGYQPQAIDISIEADLLDFYLLRQRSVTERVEIAANLINSARQFSLQCLEQQFSCLEPQQLAKKVAEAWLQEDCPTDYIPKGSRMTWIQNSAELATQLHTLFESADVPYYITGGVAAIAYGDPRTTRDVDVVIQIQKDRIAQLQSILEQQGFYVAGADDVASGRMKTLQITQIETIARADLILAEENSYNQQQFERRKQFTFPNGVEVYLASPEDVIISKLRWGLRSSSEKQQRDVLAIFKVQQNELDYQYLYQWASEFDLLEILQELTTRAGVREIADLQWAKNLYPIACEAFKLAKQAGLSRLLTDGVERADGRLYILEKNQQSQTLSVIDKGSGKLMAHFDGDGKVVESQPSLQNRQQWKAITERIQTIAQELEQSEQLPDQAEL